VADTGREALELLDRNPDVDAVLMDIMMPEMDGYQATRQLRTDPRFRKLPVIALTAKAMKGERERCLEAGASDYLTKPIDTEKLLQTLQAFLPRGPLAVGK
jgi:CheY-like chemotaxis protein